MKRLAFQMKLKKDKVEEYIEAHRNIWPSVLDEIKEAGIHNYSIYLKGLDLFGYFEVDDLDLFYHRSNNSKVNIKWQKKMNEYLDNIENRESKGPMVFMEEIFHVD